MPAPTVCAVSGTVRSINGSALSGVTIEANSVMPFVHSTDNSLISNYKVSTTSASDGTWSLSLVETTTPNTTVTITFIYATGATSPNDRKSYTVQIPNSASATFASLIGTQV